MFVYHLNVIYPYILLVLPLKHILSSISDYDAVSFLPQIDHRLF
jgi:hypothetical protein